MTCPKCANEMNLANGQYHCQLCDRVSLDSDILLNEKPLYARFKHTLILAIFTLFVLIVGIIWNYLLQNNSGIEMLFWLIFTIPLYFFITYSLLSMPVWLIPSFISSLLLDRAYIKNQLDQSSIIVINSFSLLGAAFAVYLTNLKYTGFLDKYSVSTINGDFMSGEEALTALIIGGCFLMPLAWSVLVTVKAYRTGKNSNFAIGLLSICTTVSLYGAVFYPAIKVQNDGPAVSATEQDFISTETANTMEEKQEADLIKNQSQQK